MFLQSQLLKLPLRQLKQQQWQRKRYLKINTSEAVTIACVTSVSMGLLRKFRCFGRAKIKARAHSRLNFREAKTSKPHGKACYAGYGDHFVIIELLRRTFVVDRARCKWTGRSAVEVFMENERFTVMCWRSR